VTCILAASDALTDSHQISLRQRWLAQQARRARAEVPIGDPYTYQNLRLVSQTTVTATRTSAFSEVTSAITQRVFLRPSVNWAQERTLMQMWEDLRGTLEQKAALMTAVVRGPKVMKIFNAALSAARTSPGLEKRRGPGGGAAVQLRPRSHGLDRHSGHVLHRHRGPDRQGRR